VKQHGCNTATAEPHPWIAAITDRACGYDERLIDPDCHGCHRSRAESPLEQLHTTDPRHTENGLRR
jgi:hypothetical protein